MILQVVYIPVQKVIKISEVVSLIFYLKNYSHV